MATKEKKEQVLLWTPCGMFSYPYFDKPDSGREYSDDQYKTDLFIPKALFKEQGKELQDAVLKVGREAFGKDFSLKSPKFRTPFKDTDTDDDVTNERQTDCIMIRSKAGKKGAVDKNKQPNFLGPKKNMLTADEIRLIKGGDWGRLYVAVYAYKGSKSVIPGVSLALRAVQFWKTDEGFGQGIGQLMETVTELEAEGLEDDVDTSNFDSSDDGAESVV